MSHLLTMVFGFGIISLVFLTPVVFVAKAAQNYELYDNLVNVGAPIAIIGLLAWIWLVVGAIGNVYRTFKDL